MLDILITQFVLLWAVIDPIGSVPVFLSRTSHLNKKQKRIVALEAVGISAAILIFFLVAGQFLLEAMQVPLPAFQVAGGLVLLLFALTMIFGESKPDVEKKLCEKGMNDVCRSQLSQLAVYPLAVPSIASPGAMMAVVLLTDNNRYSFIHQMMSGGIMMLVLLVTLALLLCANMIDKIIGNVGAMIISRVMGLILASVAVTNLLEGIVKFYQSI
ncbi:MarC family protein [Vibrio sp. S4M6]|uniref:MarC family protein n=1 Tax=Vibrio sinus TaxID=2946865 RepID=UPI00202AB885|nr:MarC family protein [Vibrio sinus]MCL9782569.1 MarC family protein [Vibrio sinus]